MRVADVLTGFGEEGAMILRLRLSRLGRLGVTGRQEHDMIVLNDDLPPNRRVDTAPLAAC